MSVRRRVTRDHSKCLGGVVKATKHKQARVRAPSKRHVLERFEELARHLSKHVTLNDDERSALLTICAAVAAERKKMDEEDKRSAVLVERWEVNYKEGKAERIATVHRKSGYSDWKKRTQGSAFKP